MGGVAAVLDGAAFTLEGVALHEGENRLEVVAVDAAGNRSNVSVPLVLDTLPPQISITAPADRTFVNEPLLTVSGLIDEPVAALSLNGRSVTPEGSGFVLAVWNWSRGRTRSASKQ